MTDHTYNIMDVVGSSADGPKPAIENAIARAGKKVRNMRWFEVAEMRGHIEDGKVAHWQVEVRTGFTLED